MKTNIRAGSLERLESRIAPAALTAQLINAKTVIYHDVDGDHVTVSVSQPLFTDVDHANSILTFATGRVHDRADGALDTPGVLQRIDLTGADGLSLTVSVKRAAGGDGLVAIGHISAGLDLGTVKVQGDIPSISAGHASATEPAIKSLSVHSIGLFGTSVLGSGTLESDIRGSLGSLTVTGDIHDAFLKVSSVSVAKIGTIKIGGSLIGGSGDGSGEIFAKNGVGAITIGGSVQGSRGGDSGTIFTLDGPIASLRIGRSLLGGSGDGSGKVIVHGSLGAVKIGHDLHGDVGVDSGKIDVFDDITSISIGGSLLGGAGDVDDFNSSPRHTGQIYAGGQIGPVTIGGDLKAGAGKASATIFADRGSMGAVTIRGSLIGSTGRESAYIETGNTGSDIGAVRIGGDFIGGNAIQSGGITAGGLGAVTIGGSFIGGLVNDSGAISANRIGPITIRHDFIGPSISGADEANASAFIFGGLHITSIRIGGSVLAGNDASSGDLTFTTMINCSGTIGSITIAGDVVGSVNAGGVRIPVVFSALGLSASGQDLAIGKVTIGGRAERMDLIAGLGTTFGNPDAQIGAVTIKGDFIASNILSGVENLGADGMKGTAGDNINFGDSHDRVIDAKADSLARIASITIGGQVAGTTATGNDMYGIVAPMIGSLRIGGGLVPLPAKVESFLPLVPSTTRDVFVHLIGTPV